MADDSGDKTEEPTAKRLEDARKKGQIPRSKELNTFVMMMTAAVMLIFTGRSITNGLGEIMQQQFRLSREVIFDDKSLVIYFAFQSFDIECTGEGYFRSPSYVLTLNMYVFNGK